MIIKKIQEYTCLAVLLVSCNSKAEQHELSYNPSNLPATFEIGRSASQREIDSLDIDVNPDGIGLPPGSGTVDKGREIYAVKCATCHGKTGKEGPFNKLVAIAESDSVPRGEKAIGNYWPYATTLFDYINRAMPFDAPGTLSPEEVYSLTAFLLSENKIVDSVFVVNASNLSRVEMPAKKLFVEDDRQGGPEIR